MAVKTPSLDQLIDNLLHIITSLDLTAAQAYSDDMGLAERADEE